METICTEQDDGDLEANSSNLLGQGRRQLKMDGTTRQNELFIMGVVVNFDNYVVSCAAVLYM